MNEVNSKVFGFRMGDIIKVIEIKLPFGNKHLTSKKYLDSYMETQLKGRMKNKIGEITDIYSFSTSRVDKEFQIMFIVKNYARTLMYDWHDLSHFQMVMATEKERKRFMELKKTIESQRVAEKL